MSAILLSTFVLLGTSAALPGAHRQSPRILERQSVFDQPEYNEDWASLNCDIPSITSSTNDPSLQWNDTGSTAAWLDMVIAYGQTDMSVVAGNYVGDFFHARPDLDCGELENPNCAVTVNCGQGGEANADVSAPAGYIIVNSMVQVHRMFENVYEAMESARVTVSLTVGTFTETFSPVNGALDQMKKDKMALDGLNFALSFLAIPATASIAKTLPFFVRNPVAGDVLKGYGTGLISPILTTVKDSMTQETILLTQNALADYLNTVIEGWKTSWNDAAEKIFGDLNIIGPLIYGGQMFDDGGSHSAADLGPLTEALVYANALPNVWQGGADLGMPFIATSEGVHDGGSGCEGFDPNESASIPENTWFGYPNGDPVIFEQTRVCVDDQAYWLLSGAASQRTMGSGRTQYVNYALSLDKPYGMDELDGSRWGGLTKEQLVINAVNSWKANGNKNGWPAFAPRDDTEVGDPTNSDISGIPGAVGLPVCSFATAVETSRDDSTLGSGNLIWPCA